MPGEEWDAELEEIIVQGAPPVPRYYQLPLFEQYGIIIPLKTDPDFVCEIALTLFCCHMYMTRSVARRRHFPKIEAAIRPQYKDPFGR